MTKTKMAWPGAAFLAGLPGGPDHWFGLEAEVVAAGHQTRGIIGLRERPVFPRL